MTSQTGVSDEVTRQLLGTTQGTRTKLGIICRANISFIGSPPYVARLFNREHTYGLGHFGHLIAAEGPSSAEVGDRSESCRSLVWTGFEVSSATSKCRRVCRRVCRRSKKAYRLGVVARKESRPLRVASMFADLIGCAGRRRFSPDWATASPSDRALHLPNRCGLFAVRSTAVLPLFGFNSAPVLLERTVFKAGASLQCHFQHRNPLRAHHQQRASRRSFTSDATSQDPDRSRGR